MADPAVKIVVHPVDVNYNMLEAEPECFKPPRACKHIVAACQVAWQREGYIKDKDRDTVLPEDQMEAGLYMYCVPGVRAPVLTPTGLLTHQLPSAHRAVQGIRASSTRQHDLTPTTLQEWPHVRAAMQQHQQDADSLYPRNLRLVRPQPTAPVALNSETDVATEFHVNVVRLLVPLAQSAEGAGNASWQQHPTAELIEHGTAYHVALHGFVPKAAGLPPLRSSRDRGVKPLQCGDEATSPAVHPTTSQLKSDFALELEDNVDAAAPQVAGGSPRQAAGPQLLSSSTGQPAAPQVAGGSPGQAAGPQLLSSSTGQPAAPQVAGGSIGDAARLHLAGSSIGQAAGPHLAGGSPGDAAQQEPPRKKRRLLAVGKVKSGLTEGPDEAPLPLLQAYHDPEHPHHGVAVAVIAQVYTHMQLWHLQYSFITSWFATWVLHCPPHARTTLYISDPVKPTDTEPTPQGAVAWLQKQALDKRHEKVDPYPMPPPAAPGPSGGGDGAGAAGGDGGNDSSPDAGAKRDSLDPSYQPGSRDTGGKTYGDASQTSGTHHQVEHAAVPGDSVLMEQICIGDAGSVLHARYEGAPAVIKLFGPGYGDVYDREVEAYQRLQQHQGTLIPRLLGSGYIAPGVLFVALSVVEGDTLAGLSGGTYRRAAAAALQALATLHSVEGFLHGDVHLRNIIWVRTDNTSTVDTPATCVFIDLGRARFGASAEQQQQEREALQRRLKA